MSTRAELFRWLAERPRWKAGPEPAREPVRTEAPADRRGPTTRAAKKAQYALERFEGPSSRKSTRRSANRQKNDVQFRMKRRVGEARPPVPPKAPR